MQCDRIETALFLRSLSSCANTVLFHSQVGVRDEPTRESVDRFHAARDLMLACVEAYTKCRKPEATVDGKALMEVARRF